MKNEKTKLDLGGLLHNAVDLLSKQVDKIDTSKLNLGDLLDANETREIVKLFKNKELRDIFNNLGLKDVFNFDDAKEKTTHQEASDDCEDFSPSDDSTDIYSSNTKFNEFIKQHYPTMSTIYGKWFFDIKEFENSGKRTLWMRDAPNTGKSTIANLLVLKHMSDLITNKPVVFVVVAPFFNNGLRKLEEMQNLLIHTKLFKDAHLNKRDGILYLDHLKQIIIVKSDKDAVYSSKMFNYVGLLSDNDNDTAPMSIGIIDSVTPRMALKDDWKSYLKIIVGKNYYDEDNKFMNKLKEIAFITHNSQWQVRVTEQPNEYFYALIREEGDNYKMQCLLFKELPPLPLTNTASWQVIKVPIGYLAYFEQNIYKSVDDLLGLDYLG